MRPDMLAPPSTPMVQRAEKEPEDIGDPDVPETLLTSLTTPGATQAPDPTNTPPQEFNAHEALLRGFCGHLQKRIATDIYPSLKDACQAVEDTWAYAKRSLDLQTEKLQHAETLLDQLATKAVQQGIQLRHDPYTMTIRARSMQGFEVTFQAVKTTSDELFDVLPGLLAWLEKQGYTSIS